MSNIIEQSKNRIEQLLGISYEEAIDDVQTLISEKLNEEEINVAITGVEFTGSQRFGNPNEDSDLDVVFTYESIDERVKEDYLFNILNEEPIYYYGFKLDINPIEDGNIDNYILNASKYKKDLTEQEEFNKKFRAQILNKIKHYYNNLTKLSETEVIKKLKLIPNNKIINGTPFFIATNGNIYNAIDVNNNLENVVHIDLLSDNFFKSQNINKQEFYGALSDTQYIKITDHLFDFIDHLLENLNWIKVNTGTVCDDKNSYIILPNRNISYGQHSRLKEVLEYLYYDFKQNKVWIYGMQPHENAGDDIQFSNEVEYNFSEYTPEEIMSKIDQYYRTNILTENLQPFELEAEKDRIRDVLDIMKDVEYGFISQVDGKKITDRDWIHHCDLDRYYKVNTDPLKTIKDKLGICQDQSIAVKYLMNKLHPEDTVKLFTMTKSPIGHCVPCYCHNDKWYYIENSWDKEKGLHGYFESEDELKKYLKFIYFENHKDDTPKDSKVEVGKYTMPLTEDTRSQLTAASRNAGPYKGDTTRGKNRFEVENTFWENFWK